MSIKRSKLAIKYRNCQDLSQMMKYIINDEENVEIISFSIDFQLNWIISDQIQIQNQYLCLNLYRRDHFDYIGLLIWIENVD